MKIIDRYIIETFTKLFAAIFITFILLYLFVDFFEKIRMFLSNDATISQMSSYLFYSIPIIISNIMPSAVLLATLLTYGSFAKYNEFTAMKSGGISLYRISLPTVFLAVIIALSLFLFSEFVTPTAVQKSEYIRKIEIQKNKARGFFKQNEIWYRSERAIYNFKLFDIDKNILHGVTINYLDFDDFTLKKRIDAQRAEFKNGQWIFYNMLTTEFDENNFPVLERQEEKIVYLPEIPDDFKIIQKDAEKMGFFELKKYIQKIQNEGYDVTRYKADLHGKIAFPFITIILVFIGVFFSLRSERSGGLLQSLGMGIFIGFSYWIIHAFFLSLGRSGALNPILGAWSANIMYLFACSYLMYKART